MGLTTSLYTSLSGLSANSQAISVSGNNIANANTTGFKASRADFETQFSQNLSFGSAPTADSGGTNPSQVGLGVRLGSVTRIFTDGAVQPTGVNTDVAIEGSGFLVVRKDGQTRYSRAGNLGLDNDSKLVRSGARVQGFGVDANFNVVEGALTDIEIPRGILTIAQATTDVRFAGNLNASGAVAQNGTIITAAAIYANAGATTPATAADNLTGLFSASGSSLFAAGDVITVTGASKGGRSLPNHKFEVADPATYNPASPPATESDAVGATVQDFMNFLRDVLGIDTSLGGGVTINNTGQITIEGNTGSLNHIEMSNTSILRNMGGANPTAPFNLTEQQEADGESVRTTFVAFDSLGTELVLDLTVVLESKSNTGTQWRFYVQSEDDSDVARAMGTGTLTFDINGQLSALSDNIMTIDRAGTGAQTPQTIAINFNDPQRAISALTDTTSQVSAISQDGFPKGTLDDFSIDVDGTVVGVFSNGLLRNLGRVVVATFTNPEGLREVSASLFDATASSGNAAITTPGTGGAGRIIGGALELSNVDLSQEFINLITASTGFSANSRVLTTSDQLIQELLSVVR